MADTAGTIRSGPTYLTTTTKLEQIRLTTWHRLVVCGSVCALLWYLGLWFRSGLSVLYLLSLKHVTLWLWPPPGCNPDSSCKALEHKALEHLGNDHMC